MLRPDSWIIRFLTRICDLMLLNILFLFALATVVFSGAAATALYAVTLKMAEGKPCSPARDFLRAARENFPSTVPATILLLTDGMLVALFCTLLYTEGEVFLWRLLVLLPVPVILLTALLGYLFPLLAKFENTFSRHFRNAAYLSLAHLPVTFLLTAVNLLPLLCAVFSPGLLRYFLPFEQLIGAAAGAYVNAFYLNRIFSR